MHSHPMQAAIRKPITPSYSVPEEPRGGSNQDQVFSTSTWNTVTLPITDCGARDRENCEKPHKVVRCLPKNPTGARLTSRGCRNLRNSAHLPMQSGVRMQLVIGLISAVGHARRAWLQASFSL